VCGLGHLFEKQGIATTAITLIRLHAEKIAPPRALWVPFDLGRPCGAPNDPAFQRKLVHQALSLLESHEGPVLEDFPDDEPQAAEVQELWSCPISFARSEETLTGAAAVERTLVDEILAMKPWCERAVEARGRTTVSDVAESLEEISAFIASMFDDELPDSPDADRSLADAVRLRAEDLKAFMLESASAQPGNPTPRELDDWFWNETKTAQVFHQLRAVCMAQDLPAMKTAGFLLVPLVRQQPLAA
jgi:hypothetical protein